jgi:sugar lactone lactonase YvrE
MTAELSVFDDRRCTVGEGPHFDDRTGRVWWVDVPGRRVLWRAFGGAERGELPLPADVSAAVPTTGDALVVGLPDGLWLLRPDGALTPLAALPARDDGVARRTNDAKADPAGRLWVGTMAYDATPLAGALYHLDPVTRTLVEVEPVTVGNGLGWSPDGRTMYYVDTPTRRIDAFAYDPAGPHRDARRTFATIETGSPDGLCVDADGGVWVALWGAGAVRRYTPDGRLDRVVELPTPQVSSCAFAGPDLDTLIITTAARDRPGDPDAGRTYAHRPGLRGLPADRWT